MSLQAPKSAGCLVNLDDLPRVFASITVYGACLGFGAGIAVLGASVPQLANGINVPDTGIGRMFVYRGVGFLLGALLSIKLLPVPNLYLSKHMICCILILIAGCALSLVPVVAQNYPPHSEHNWVLVTMVGSLFFIEGMCFGGIDAFSALAISEMWGTRTQPWMQTKNLFSNFGCLIGPALVDGYGYHRAYLLIALMGCASMLGFAFDAINNHIRACLKLRALDHTLLCAELSLITHSMETIEDGSSLDQHATENESNEWDDLVFPTLKDKQYTRISSDVSDHGLPRCDNVFTNQNFSSPRKRVNTLETTATPMHSPRGNNSVLPFSSSEPARGVRHKRKPVSIVLVPRKVRLLLALFVFWDLGLLCTYGAWISTYVETFDLDGGLNHSINEHDAQSAAAQVLAVFYATQILGSVLSVPASVIFSTTALLRCQLVLAVLAGVLMCIPHGVYSTAGWLIAVTGLEAGLMGLALGCMYPLIMTVVNDYGATMTSHSTIAVVLGGCIGEAAAPFLVSLAIAHFGPAAFVVCICALTVALVVTYAVLHVHLRCAPDVPPAAMIGDEKVVAGPSSPVLGSRIFRFDHDTSRGGAARPVGRISEESFCATESPRTLMNYSGVSRITSCNSSLDGLEHGCDEEKGEDTQLPPLVLPSTRYHRVRSNNNNINYVDNVGSPGKFSYSNSDTNNSSNSSARSSPGIAMMRMGISTSPRTTASSTGGSNQPSGYSIHNSASSLYVKSFRVPLFPTIEHPNFGYTPVDNEYEAAEIV